MAKARKRKPADVPEGAPDWMVTFSDCMTLLLTFFVLLLSFSSFDDETLPGLGASFSEAFPSVGRVASHQTSSMWQSQEVSVQEVVTEGTETKTDATKKSKNFMRERKPLDFRNLKVFTIPSDKMFWGKRAALSTEGQDLLDTFGSFLRSQPSRVVISEIASGAADNISIQRAWAVVEYLSSIEGVSKGLFSISATTNTSNPKQSGRMLEITLLERSIY